MILYRMRPISGTNNVSVIPQMCSSASLIECLKYYTDFQTFFIIILKTYKLNIKLISLIY